MAISTGAALALTALAAGAQAYNTNRTLRRIQPEAPRIPVPIFDVRDVEPIGESELLLTERLDPAPAGEEDALLLDDILAELGQLPSRQASRTPVLVGFAAETGNAAAKAREKRHRKQVDLIVANDVSEPGAGLDVATNAVTIVGEGEDQVVPLLSSTGYNAFEIVQRQQSCRQGRVFPFNARTVSAYFTRAVTTLGLRDLHLHDLRHEGISRLFEAGYRIEQVALVSGHRDWAMLKRYTHPRAVDLHRDIPSGTRTRCPGRRRPASPSGTAYTNVRRGGTGSATSTQGGAPSPPLKAPRPGGGGRP